LTVLCENLFRQCYLFVFTEFSYKIYMDIIEKLPKRIEISKFPREFFHY